MRTIVKQPEPTSLTEYRVQDWSSYEGYADKEALRRALVTEQGELCCYCMRRISADRHAMKIEHWRPRSRHPTEQLDYGNLLAACRGGEGQPPRLQHCDTRKGDSDLRWNPADPANRIETRLRYEPDGTIRAHDDGEFDAQLDEVLNLNLSLLKNNRKSALDGILRWWQEERARPRPVERARLERERDRWRDGGDALKPYCQVVVWWLEQRLARLSP
ncbi:MAG: TIGR02646 family protein [bacterium]|nr:TIGR02646 family protein [bacterium]MDE0669778.1 TIGR02646 family protein [bacterium]MXZ30075.1 TIGR02646 family protein [Acidimicrobiia bacterium]MYE68197.1 TIGR02646 family protein [Acidimicrobiia bacterium]MYJ12755.1 TIGR02646 family protein [Acidimicrobiia bacterium]